MEVTMSEILVYFDGGVLAIVRYPEYSMNPSEAVSLYAKDYDFDRTRLTWSFIPVAVTLNVP